MFGRTFQTSGRVFKTPGRVFQTQTQTHLPKSATVKKTERSERFFEFKKQTETKTKKDSTGAAASNKIIQYE